MSQDDDETTNNTAGDADGIRSSREAGNRRSWHVQWPLRWPITRAPKHRRKVSSYDPALIKWLDHLAQDGNADSRLTVDEFSSRINLADHRRERWEVTYYASRATVIALAAAVTALASASAAISGTAGLSIKIVTAVLSFVIAVTTGVLELLQVTNRWRLYRVLRNELWQAAWQLRTNTTYSTPKKFEVLSSQLGAALDDFERQYLMQVLISPPHKDSGQG